MSSQLDEEARDRNPRQAREGFFSPGGAALLFGLIGATATIVTLRSQGYSSWRSTIGSSGNGGYMREVWKRFNCRMQEEYEEEMRRVERIKRMQNVFNEQRSKYKMYDHEGWTGEGPGGYQHFQRDGWYWKTDTDQNSNFRPHPSDSANYMMSHHYSILGLDRSRAKQYTDAEIKVAFRAKAMEFHPDQNQDNKEVAEAKFKEVISSYEAIKLGRKNGMF